MQMRSTLRRMLGLVQKNSGATQQRVYRVKGADELEDVWEKRIIELSDGRSVGEIIDILFKQETRVGAGAVDIGLWRNVFDKRALKAISELNERGFIRLRPGDGT